MAAWQPQRDQYNVRDSAQQFNASEQSKQYNVSNGTLIINEYGIKQDELLQALRGIIAESLRPMPGIVPQVAIEDQFMLLAKSMRNQADLRMPESAFNGAVWRLRRDKATSPAIQPFWLAPKFQGWWHCTTSATVFVRGNIRGQVPTKNFCLGFMNLLHDESVPTLWSLRADDQEPRAYTCPDVIKSLFVQAMSLASASNRPWSQETICSVNSKFVTASSLADWTDLLTLVLCALQLENRIVLVIDAHLLSAQKGNHKLEHLQLILALRDTARILQVKAPRLMLKVIFVSYGGAMFDDEAASSFTDILIPVKLIQGPRAKLADRTRSSKRSLATALSGKTGRKTPQKDKVHLAPHR
ncbi:hypothetical protein F5X68DRAFT_3642 [Plectosphaerella plurivora]|uniref:Uncharacterized protein n=1 Tax=Plectosphaerella plurivora TaxID=936078 RepID=A0A9P8VMG8_9PEZI|nr:hypothetical protein F5X68DRAFT_3642 [Plectosphaerella plurivora]